MSKTPEQLIKTAIMGYLRFIPRSKFWWNKSVGTYDPVRKIFRRGKSRWEIKGVSDILGLWDGRFVAIEVKSKTGRLTPEQRTFIQEVNELGGLAFMARSVDDVKNNLLPGKTNELQEAQQ